MSKRNIYRIIYLLIFILTIVAASSPLPAYASRLPWLMMIAIIDLYMLHRISSAVQNKYSKQFLLLITWLPSALLLIFLFSVLFMSPVDWQPVIRTYLLALVYFFYIVRLPWLLAFLFFGTKRLFYRRKKFSLLSKISQRVSFALSFALALLMILGMTVWVYDFEVVEIKIPFKNLPASFEGYKIVHFSDVHLGRWHSGKPLKRAIDKMNALEPDLIAFTGDLVNYSTSEALPYKQLLSGLNAKDGVYAVLGNHDYGDYMQWRSPKEKDDNIDQMFSFLNEIGWQLLENRNITIFREDGCLVLAGTGHFSTKKYIPDRAKPDYAFGNLDESCPLILLTHTPEFISSGQTGELIPDLVLSGHTHALQLGIRFQGRDYSPAALAFDFWGGLYEIGSNEKGRSFLYVNRGLGHISFPFRIGMKPEITLIYLTSDKNL